MLVNIEKKTLMLFQEFILWLWSTDFTYK